jgi:hypothetical protein
MVAFLSRSINYLEYGAPLEHVVTNSGGNVHHKENLSSIEKIVKKCAKHYSRGRGTKIV